jgi:putative RNase toxin 24 of polymorphic toxin system
MTGPILAWANQIQLQYDRLQQLTDPWPIPNPNPPPGQPTGPEILGQPAAPPPQGPLINVPAGPGLGPLINVPAPPQQGPLINVPAGPPPGPLINVPSPQGPVVVDRNTPPPVYKRGEKLPPAGTLLGSGGEYQGKRLPPKNTPNSVLYKRNAQTGRITNYIVYDEKGNEIKRVDLEGHAHGPVPTPHVVEAKVNTNPVTGEEFVQEERVARPAQPEEIP